MPEGSHLLIPHAEPQVGPDFFAYYTREIEELFSQKEGHIPSLSSKPVASAETLANVNNDDTGDSDCKGNGIPSTSFARKLFCNGVGDSLSGFKKERLKASLKQSVTVLGQETDETLQSVLYVMKMKNQLYVKERFTKSESPSSADFDSNKKRMMSSSLSPGSDVIQSQPLGILLWEEASSSEAIDRKEPNIDSSEKRGQCKRTCIYCKATSTPQWRPGPDGRKNLCNACGLRFRKKKLFLPEFDELEESTEASDSEGIDRKYRSLDSLEESQSRGLHSSCSNCKTISTPQWRGGPDGQKNLCNACGIRNKRKKLFPPELDKVEEQAEFPLELDKVEEQTELDKGLRSLLGIDESIPKETLVKYADELVKKYSDELHVKMENMEHQLEKYLGVIMSNCRKMTLEEKLNLRKLIQDLPQKNLDQIVEIILQARKLPEGHSCNMLHIDLENEDNVTLWRLYYYVEAVERARHLASVESSN